MIIIKKSPSADSRTAIGEVSKNDLYLSSQMHIEDVQKGCEFLAGMIVQAGRSHDHTKLEYIGEFYRDFSAKLKGEEFKKAGWYQKHLTERHHLNDRCPDDVNLIDVLERVIDITMAGMARSGTIFDDEISSDILQLAYKNTIKLLKSEIAIEQKEANGVE